MPSAGPAQHSAKGETLTKCVGRPTHSLTPHNTLTHAHPRARRRSPPPARPAPAAAALRPAPACVVAARRLFSTGGAPFRRDDFDSSEEYSGDEEEEEYSGDEDVVYDRLRSRGFSVSMFSSAGTHRAGRSVPPFPLV